MCARFTLRKKKLRQIADGLEAELGPEDEALFRPRYSVAPTDLAWIVDLQGGDRRVLRPARWGYLVADGKRPLVNVRGEQVGPGAGFREAFASRRCVVVVADGFYEWPRQGPGALPLSPRGQRPGVARRSLPAAARRRGPRAFDRAHDATQWPRRALHERIPVIVPPPPLDRWLGESPGDTAALIVPAPEDALAATRVSKHVNNVRNNDPGCVAAAEPA